MVGAYHPGTDAAVSGDVRVRLNARPGVREVGLPETLVNCAGARSVADIVVNGTRDAVLSVAVPWSHVQEVFYKRAILYAIARAGAVTAEAIAGIKYVGGGKVACVARLVPVSARISIACCMRERRGLRLGSGISTLLAQQPLVRKHVQSVPGEEPSVVVDPPGLVLVRAEEVVESRERAIDAGEGGPLEHQAALSVEVADFLGA